MPMGVHVYKLPSKYAELCSPSFNFLLSLSSSVIIPLERVTENKCLFPGKTEKNNRGKN